MAVGRVATILLVAAWGMNSQAAAQEGDPIDIWKLPAFTPASGPYQTNWTSVTKYRTPHWYRDVKFGYWAHWDPQTVPEGNGNDWFAMHMYTPGSDAYKWTTNKFGNLNEYGYKDICNLWKCDKWDPDAVIKLCRTDDLITKYKPDILWFDDAFAYMHDLENVYLGLGDTMALQLTANYFNKMAAAGKSGALSINGITPKEANASVMTVHEDSVTEKIQPYPWQCMNSMGPWHFDASNPLGYHSDPTSLMQLLVRCAAANGNLVVGIPIRAQGDMYTGSLPIFKKIGEWLRINGEGIYSTRPYAVMCDSIGEDKVYYTRTAGHVYAFVSKWPGSKLALPGCRKNNGTIGVVGKVELLAGPKPIACAFAQDDAALTVTLPETEPAIADIKVYALRITHDKTWANDDDSGIFFHGWQHQIGRAGAFNNDWNCTDAGGDSCRLTFSGTGIEYIAEKGADFGDVMVTLDNGPAQSVSLKGGGTQQVVYKATDLPAGDHTLKLACQGNGRINVDAFKVLNGRIKVEGFNVAAIGVDAIHAPNEPGQNPENEKPKSKIDKIKHVEVQ